MGPTRTATRTMKAEREIIDGAGIAMDKWGVTQRTTWLARGSVALNHSMRLPSSAQRRTAEISRWTSDGRREPFPSPPLPGKPVTSL